MYRMKQLLTITAMISILVLSGCSHQSDAWKIFVCDWIDWPVKLIWESENSLMFYDDETSIWTTTEKYINCKEYPIQPLWMLTWYEWKSINFKN